MKFPRIISSFLNPFFITFYFFIITLNLNTKAINPLPEKAKWIIYGLIIIITYVIPGLFIKFYGSFIQRFFKYGQKEKRIIYFFIVTVFYYLTYYLLIQLRLSPIYSLFLFGCTSLLVLCLIVSFFWNISIYMVAIGALSGGLLGVSMVFNINLLFPIFMVILFSGLLGYSRLSLGKHRPLEVYGGYLTGFAIMLVHYFLF